MDLGNGDIVDVLDDPVKVEAQAAMFAVVEVAADRALAKAVAARDAADRKRLEQLCRYVTRRRWRTNG